MQRNYIFRIRQSLICSMQTSVSDGAVTPIRSRLEVGVLRCSQLFKRGSPEQFSVKNSEDGPDQ